MRRKNPISIRVKAPSRGLVTRLPTEIADQFKEGDTNRTFVAAANVRFEDGVVANAPGFSRLSLNEGISPETISAHYRLDFSYTEPSGNSTATYCDDATKFNRRLQYFDPSVVTGGPVQSQTVQGFLPGKIGNALHFPNAFLTLRQMNGDDAFSPLDDFTLAGWFKITSAGTGAFRLAALGGILDSLDEVVTSGGSSPIYDYPSGTVNSLNGRLSWDLGVRNNVLLATVVEAGGGDVYRLEHTASLQVGVWYFFAFSYILNSGFRLTINNVTVSQALTTGIEYSPPTGWTHPIFKLGGAAYVNINGPVVAFPQCALDSVTFWKGTALNDAQLTQLYNEGAGQDYPFVGNACSFIAQGNVLQSDPYPLFYGTEKTLHLVQKSYDSESTTFSATLDPIYEVPANAIVDVARRWTHCDFFDKVVFAQEKCPPQYYFEGSVTTDLPGLPDNSTYSGVTAFQNHLMLWNDTTVYWSDLNDYSLWIPVAETIFSNRFTLSSAFAQPVGGALTGYVYLDESTIGLTVGQFVRIEEPSKDYFTVSNATNAQPIVLTTDENHSFVVGDRVNVRGVVGNTAANDNWTVSAVTSNTLTLQNSTGDGSYVSGGVVQRIPLVNYYTVSEVTPATSLTNFKLSPFVSSGSATISGNGTVSTLLSLAPVDWKTGTHLSLGASPSDVLVVDTVNESPVPDGVPYYTVRSSASVTASAIDVDHDNTGLRANVDYVSVSSSSSTAVDIYLVTGVTVNKPVGAPAYTTLSLQKKYSGTNVRTTGQHLPGHYVVWSPSFTVTKASAGNIVLNSSSTTAQLTVSLKYGVKLKVEELTGRRTAGSVPSGSALVTLDANEAGSADIVGASDNGRIYQIASLGDYAVIFKNRTVLAMQYVGRLSGTFFVRTELRDEGLVGRNALVRLNDNRMVFLGNRELYDYRGGSNLTPVCQQYTRTLFADLDRSRLDEVLLHHREQRNEVWVIYPVKGAQRVLIWNYVEDTATLDDYTDTFSAITAVAQTRWSSDPTWENFGDTTWAQLDPLLIWDELVGAGEEIITLLASSDGDVVMHGTHYSRDGEDYYSFAETMDYDFGDPDAWKYVDTVTVQLDVRNPVEGKPISGIGQLVYVQVGTKTTPDASVQWTEPKSLQVQGNGQSPTKVNPGGSGRYVRLRFYSNTSNFQWRIGGFEIHARRGNTY